MVAPVESAPSMASPMPRPLALTLQAAATLGLPGAACPQLFLRAVSVTWTSEGRYRATLADGDGCLAEVSLGRAPCALFEARLSSSRFKFRVGSIVHVWTAPPSSEPPFHAPGVPHDMYFLIFASALVLSPQQGPRFMSLAAFRDVEYPKRESLRGGSSADVLLRLTCLSKQDAVKNPGQARAWRVQEFEMGDGTCSMRAYCLDHAAGRLGRQIFPGCVYDVSGAYITTFKGNLNLQLSQGCHVVPVNAAQDPGLVGEGAPAAAATEAAGAGAGLLPIP